MTDTNEEKMREIDSKEREKGTLLEEKRGVEGEMDELLRQSLVMQRAVTSTANSLQKVTILTHFLST